jgi:hypothetical protein
LTVLVKDGQATYQARGYAATNSTGRTYFEPSRCVFLAVYAGETASQAEDLLARVKATGRFFGANVRRMQAVIVYP